ncbi:unnamed protein product [Adineta ricciae]|uniref:Uncharacterized protein n=1 Tax=Adineta ricciae TaxID=249248 RepID=A0A816EVL3_ADIRI|nr:unnamed protein product [Adineta ricciae]CAF1654390.1 unnamed protein product [Adineta ricciae]
MKWFILFIFFTFNFTNCFGHLCNYIIKNADSTSDLCLSNECHKYLDPLSLTVKPNTCKANFVSLAFSSFQTYQAFLDQTRWELSVLFPKKSQQTRLLRIYLNQIHVDDRPTEENHLNRLGNHIDSYQIYVRNLPNELFLQRFIHYDPDDPQWFIIKIQLYCNSFIQYDGKPCSVLITSPSVFAPQRPKLVTTITSNLLSSSTSTTQKTSESIYFILLILIPLGILSITIILSISVYWHLHSKRSSQTDGTLSSISQHIDSTNRSTYHGRVRPYQISRLPSPHKESLYKETE